MIPFKEDDTFSAAFTLSQQVYDGFISTFGDINPLHTDASFARDKGFEDKVMQGNILNGFISYFIGMALPIKNVIILSQDILFRAPVYMGESLTLMAKVEDIHESVNVVTFKYDFTNKQNIKVAKGHFQIGIL
ncbi:MAG: MaoC/PaaZ C-terminal domain-containing protein [Bacteroidales bacterium]